MHSFLFAGKKNVCMRNENIQFTLRAGYLRARLSQVKKKSRDKQRVMEVSGVSFSEIVVIWFYISDSLSILNFAINSFCNEQVGEICQRALLPADTV